MRSQSGKGVGSGWEAVSKWVGSDLKVQEGGGKRSQSGWEAISKWAGSDLKVGSGWEAEYRIEEYRICVHMSLELTVCTLSALIRRNLTIQLGFGESLKICAMAPKKANFFPRAKARG